MAIQTKRYEVKIDLRSGREYEGSFTLPQWDDPEEYVTGGARFLAFNGADGRHAVLKSEVAHVTWKESE